MDVEFTECKVDSKTIILTARFTACFDDLKEEAHKSYSLENIRNMVRNAVAEKMADEYFRANKMDLVNSIKKEDILNGIQLKIIEGFSLNERR